MSEAGQALLTRCVEVLQRNGFSQLSLRELAAAVGTSHRMLIYHFGSWEGLLAQVVARVEAEQREALASLAAHESDLAEVGRLFWQRVSDPALAPAERLFFEIYAQALYGRDWTHEFRRSVITAWEAPVSELLQRNGFSAADARRRTRLGIAATRGLLLDLLLTGDREVLNDAAELLGEILPAKPPKAGRAKSASAK
ncbi:TetR/AcrR family transcriptional regulator [Catelliglobosispora koreensis]|uniref:TetR/AcrR family transcriptional regulator n=1 Tax=Catelliglobosispora koreensis TaxID=129052 RepID=UPI0003688D85|nr:helix-turn-helix domain-containing protein [Catelliglobosispora koreensis]